MKSLFCLGLTLLIINCASAQWKSTPGPYLSSAFISMDMKNIQVSGSNLCALINNQVYLSNNKGVSWMYASNGLSTARTLVFRDSTIFVGSYNGVYISSDWGATYTAANNGLPSGKRVDALQLQGNTLVAAIYDFNSSEYDVYYSTNNGGLWTLSIGLHNKETLCFASNGTHLYAGTWNDGLYMSLDSGVNWINIGLNTTSINVLAADSGRIFAGENSSSGILYLSQNNGGSWTQINNGLSPYICSIAIYGNYIYAATYWNGTYRSINNGSSWSPLGIGCGYLSVNSIAVDGTHLYASSSDGFSSLTTQNLGWQCGLATYNLSIKSLVSYQSNIVAAAKYLIHNSLNNGTSWNYNLLNINAVATNDSIVIAGSNGSIYRSLNWGTTWQFCYSVPNSAVVSNIVFKDSIAYAATLGKGVFYSNNNGLSWTAKNSGLLNLNINTIAYSDSALIAGSNNAGIFISKNQGTSWYAANSGLPDTCIQTLATYEHIIYAGTKSHGIYKSTNNGVSWMQLSNAGLNSNILCLYTAGVNVFAGIKDKGFFMSPDNGLNWTAYNSGLMNFNVSTLTENGTVLYAGTTGQYDNGGGVWKRSVASLPLTFSVKKTTVSHRTTCEGEPTTIKVTAIGGVPPYSYSWNTGNQTPSLTVAPLTTTTYYLTLTDSNLTSITTQVTISVKPKPATPVLSINGDSLLSSSLSVNIWIQDNLILGSTATNYFIPNQPGNYSVMTVANGCFSDRSNVINVVGITELSELNGIQINPNPAKDYIVVVAPVQSILEIFNPQGRLLSSIICNESEVSIDLTGFSTGLYFLKISTAKKTVIKKFIKE